MAETWKMVKEVHNQVPKNYFLNDTKKIGELVERALDLEDITKIKITRLKY